MRPDAGEAIGLQFQLYRQLVGANRIAPLPLGLHLPGDTEQILHMMANFMPDDIGLREITRRAKTAAQFLEERQFDLDLVVARTVERPGG